MLDAHVHIERGPYEIEWIGRFVDQAVQRGIKKLHLLEHSHRFREFSGLYSEVAQYNSYQSEWLNRKMGLSIDDYKRLIDRARVVEWPIEVEFGLEICYMEDREDLIREVTDGFEWDFLTGSVHWIDSWGFDHKAELREWEGKEVDKAYARYYSIMMNLVKSGLFTTLAHPDSIKCFGYYASYDLEDTYKALAAALKQYRVKVEQSAGLHMNYNHPELGMNERMLSIFKAAGVELVTASDAHRPEDVGRFIREMQIAAGN